MVTTWSSPDHSGSVVDDSAVACHCVGAAPGTPASASLASWVAAQARTSSLTSSSGAQTSARSLPTTSAGASTRDAVTGATSLACAAVGGQRSEFVAERRRDGTVVSFTVDGRHENVRPSPAEGSDEQSALVGQHRRPRGHALAAHAVDVVDEFLGGEHTASRNRVGPQPFLNSGQNHELPLAAQCGVRGQHRHGVTCGSVTARHRRQRQPAHVVGDTAESGTGGPADVLVDDVEQRGDRVEVSACRSARRPTSLDGTEPAPLQPAVMPGLPQREPRVLAVRDAASRRVHHRAHAAQRAGQLVGKVDRSAVERVHEEVSELAGASVGAAQRAAQLAQRHRVDSTDRTGEQGQRLLAGESVESSRPTP